MTVNIEWDNEEKTVVRMEMVGKWTWTEAYEGSQKGYAMLETVDYVVNIIIDLRRSSGLPMLALTHARNMIARRHPRTGLTVFIGVNALFLMLWRTFKSAYPKISATSDFTFAATIDEAHQIFAERAGRAAD
jgi:hypothetical protein